MAAIRKHQVLIIAGETGSGKTTQIPKMCLQAGLVESGRIACTQPRRVAALSISRRLSEELKTEWGQFVGARIRFTDKTAPSTAIAVMTDGMLLNEVQFDPDLRRYSALIIDEAHERSLNIDFLLGYLQGLRKRRPDLKILITSATIDTEAFSKAFDDAPVIEVSGRTYPVDVIYAPIDELQEDSGDFTYIEAMGTAVERILSLNQPGDILCFLPGEKDIRETASLLDGGLSERVEVLPLFGRLSNSDQQKIFRSSQRRKVILSTNIAETSITIPGIRFVVDAGLARMSRYHPQSNALRLPIERVARSSADQRKGRAGRIAPGVCVRLYDEKDYESRPAYTTPELLRSNLAAVILRMMAFRLGEIEDFPFITPPSAGAIQSGYNLLHQLGAIDEDRCLTPMGKRLARLPVDPTVGRMILQATQEGCLREILVIAAGLSIQDPRERPMEAADKADEMHRKFADPQSDFLSLLNIWKAYHEQMESLTQAKLRKFCKQHFLSYLRMREWRDIHSQLEHSIRDIGGFKFAQADAEYHQIHRALLSGLLHGVAEKELGNTFRMAHQRRIDLFPGSVLYDRKAAKAARARKKPATPVKSSTPDWILCAEIVETSRLFGRNAAEIDPAWIEELGAHLIRTKYTEPVYDERSERVVLHERKLLSGLEISRRRRSCFPLQPDVATELFIRHGLVQGALRSQPAFLKKNLALREKIEDFQTRLRAVNTWELDDRIFNFYKQRIPPMGSQKELTRWIRHELKGDDSTLEISEDDLVDRDRFDFDKDKASFPESVRINNAVFGIDYAYKPGDETDGATLKVPIETFQSFDPAQIDWVVPGWIEERILCLLKSLPKDHRRHLIPLAETARKCLREVQQDKGPLVDQLTRILGEQYQLRVWPEDWNPDSIPEHLRPRIAVVDNRKRTLASGREWQQVAEQVDSVQHGKAKKETSAERRLEIWRKARAQHERVNLTRWDFPDFPKQIEIGQINGMAVPAYPGIQREKDESLSLRLFETLEEAEAASRIGFIHLAIYLMGRELGWLEKDLQKELKRVEWLASPLLSAKALFAQVRFMLWSHLFTCKEVLPLEQKRLDATITQAKERSRGLIPQCVDLLEGIFNQWTQLQLSLKNFPDALETLNGLVHPRFLIEVRWAQLQHYPRYLKALEIRQTRATQNPTKDADKAQRLRQFVQALKQLGTDTVAKRQYRWLLEEYRVQIYAQELGTAEKVSPSRLEDQLKSLKR